MDIETRRFKTPLERFRYPLAPGETWNQWVDNFNERLNRPAPHATHVAGIIAAADNGFGTTGVAPQAELVLAKGKEGKKLKRKEYTEALIDSVLNDLERHNSLRQSRLGY